MYENFGEIMLNINKILNIFMVLLMFFKFLRQKFKYKKCNLGIIYLSFVSYKIRYELRNLHFKSKF
jgi:hypothetical protein